MPKYILNKAQKEAVEYTKGPLLIVAGAGTGKTTVIARKICHLIESGLAKPEEILALTFNDKAAEEMVDRVDEMLSIGYADLQISTFHAFGRRLLERHGLDIGLNNQFKLLTETAAWLLVRENFARLDLDYYHPLGNPHKHIKEFIKHFSKCKDELISPAEYLEYAENVKLDKDDAGKEEKSRLTEIANAYHIYNQLLLDKASLDFGDLIYYSVKLLEERPAILSSLQKRYKYILVDEFQDVNWAQYQLVRMLAGQSSPQPSPLQGRGGRRTPSVATEGVGGGFASQLTVVGDDDQSIYAFRGASVSNIMRFKDDFPSANEVVLSENYRSGQKILDLAYKSIQNNNPDRLEVKLKINKELKSATKSKSIIEHKHVEKVFDEARFVAQEILKLKTEDKDAVWDDFAILVRANTHTEPFISELQKQGIPYEFLAASGLYRQPAVLDCVNFFTVLTDHFESTSIYRLLRMPFLQFKENDLQTLTHYAKKKSITYYEALKMAGAIGLSKHGVAICDKLIALIHAGLQKARDDKPTAVLYNFLEQSGYLAYLAHEEEIGNAHAIRQIYHLQQFFDYIAEYEEVTGGGTVFGFSEHFKAVDESGDQGALYQPSDTPDSVNILTAHRAKGLEFKYVFVVNLVEDRFPSRDRGEAIEVPLALIKEQLPEGDSHIEEERRLFYVAITRAKESLYLTSASDYGGVRAKKISRFLAELGFAIQSPVGARGRAPLREVGKVEHTAKGTFEYELPTSYSFSQLKSYQTCPYQYKLGSVLKMPTKGSAAFSFGQGMHATLQDFYLRVKELNGAEQTNLFSEPKNKSKSGKVEAPSLKELLSMYEKHWIGDWYDSKAQRENYYNEGKKILEVFYDSHDGNWRVPVELESFFKIKIGDYFLSGRIDRVDQLADGSLEIIDYKTGTAKEKLVGDDKDQLLIYQIAATELPEYKNYGKVSLLTYLYLNENKTQSFLGEPGDLEKLKTKLEDAIKHIQSRNFTATPSKFACGFCAFKDICEYKV